MQFAINYAALLASKPEPTVKRLFFTHCMHKPSLTTDGIDLVAQTVKLSTNAGNQIPTGDDNNQQDNKDNNADNLPTSSQKSVDIDNAYKQGYKAFFESSNAYAHSYHNSLANGGNTPLVSDDNDNFDDNNNNKFSGTCTRAF